MPPLPHSTHTTRSPITQLNECSLILRLRSVLRYDTNKRRQGIMALGDAVSACRLDAGTGNIVPRHPLKNTAVYTNCRCEVSALDNAICTSLGDSSNERGSLTLCLCCGWNLAHSAPLGLAYAFVRERRGGGHHHQASISHQCWLRDVAMNFWSAPVACCWHLCKS